MLISVIIPCFNEEHVIETTIDQLKTILVDDERFCYEFLFIDDGSRDRTAELITKAIQQEGRIRILRLSRNFGHQAAVSAGIRHCLGDLAAIIDADLQDPLEVIPEMVRQLLDTGSNVVYGVRKRRAGETLFKRATAKVYYILLNKLSEVPLPRDAGDFRIIDRRVIDEFNQLGEKNKYIRGLISWMGFKQTPFYYARNPRHAGRTKYTFFKMLRFAMTGIFYFSKKPLKIATTFGFLSVALASLLALWIVFNKLANPAYLISGWASVILTVMYFAGVQLLTIGILGHYVGNLFDEIKNRPEYIVLGETFHRQSRRSAKPRTLPTFDADLDSLQSSLDINSSYSKSEQQLEFPAVKT